MNRSNATAVLIALLVLTNAFTVVKVLGTAASANHTARVLAVSQRNQLANRTSNVAVWCSAIDAGRAYDRAFVARAQAGLPKSKKLPYTLGLLNCKQLEGATMKSALP